MRAAVAVLGMALAAIALSGCSQIAAIAPVGGDHLAEVRFATGDILVEQGVDILTMPVCTGSGDVVSCTGETLGGQAITTTSTATELTVTVGSKTIYDGSIQDALNDALRSGS